MKIIYPEEYSQIILDKYRGGMMQAQIAREMGVSECMVRNRLLKMGVDTTKPRYVKDCDDVRTHGRSIYWSNAMISQLSKIYPCHTNDDVAEIMGLSKNVIKRKAYKLGLQKNTNWLMSLRLNNMIKGKYRNRGK